MMCPVEYCTVIRSKNHVFDYRMRMVRSALEIGVKPTARAFGTTPPTVRKWRDRYRAEGPAGLHDPGFCPHPVQDPAGQAARPVHRADRSR